MRRARSAAGSSRIASTHSAQAEALRIFGTWLAGQCETEIYGPDAYRELAAKARLACTDLRIGVSAGLVSLVLRGLVHADEPGGSGNELIVTRYRSELTIDWALTPLLVRSLNRSQCHVCPPCFQVSRRW
jgi:hypothetical protein